MVDAESLFVNLADIKAINSRFDYLTDEQKEVLQRFFGNFRNEEQQSQIKARFIELWQVMGAIYKEFRARLYSQSLSYEGMQYRDVIEHFDNSMLTYDHYVIVGFNVLNNVERRLFDNLQASGKAIFYWDYDKYYYENPQHEAGLFVRENIERYGNALTDHNIYDNLSRLPEINYVSASTDNAQARYLHEWLSKHHTEKKEQETAVVLCNEDIAIPVLHALPTDKVRNVNVTMGFKLAQTPVYTLIDTYLKLHTAGYMEEKNMYISENVRLLLTHPYIKQLYPDAPQWQQELFATNRLYLPTETLTAHPVLGELFMHSADNAGLLQSLTVLIERCKALLGNNHSQTDAYTQLYEEALFRIYQLTSNFRAMIEEGILNLRTLTLVRLMQRVMKQASIPFHGEPAIGLQIMGVLETRNLDFRHIILLSTNEGKLPKISSEASFIPYNLREAFDMTTLQRQNAVYAYYFYRMIQRAEQVTIVYNDGTDGMNKQEPSRYLMQLQVEFPGVIRTYNMLTEAQPTQHTDICIEQTADTRRKLQQHFAYDPNRRKNYKLSPSAINDYLDCRLRFYLKHVEDLTPPDEMKVEIDVSHFGIIFHKSAELAYDKLTERGDMIHDFELKALYNDEVEIQRIVDEAFRQDFFHTEIGEPLPFNGTQLIVRHAVCGYLKQLLRLDAKRAPFRYIQSEKKVQHVVTINSHGTKLDLLLGGTVDRIDSKGDTTRIIDYKTGGKQKSVKSVEDLFARDTIRDGYVFQAFYYAHLLKDEYATIAPSLLFVRKTSDENFEPNIVVNRIPVTDFSEYSEDFARLLTETIDEIFNSDIPYTAATNLDACKYCKFTSLCRRKVESFR
jgi:CRISPR/Cas system-associated exonuclease Cas4 (RecB family)